VVGVILSGVCLPTSWAGFSLLPSIGDVNRSRAGGSAAAEDATTAYNNPAGMMRLEGSQIAAVAKVFFSSATFTNDASTDALGSPLSGGNGGDGGSTTLVPSIYYTHAMNKKWSFGLAINSPFGLSTEYDPDWVGRYDAIKTGIETININPSFGYRINNQWSVGAGASAQYVNATLSSAIDYGAVCLSLLPPATCAAANLPGPQSADGIVEMEADDWGYTWNLGILWSSMNWRAGLAYRSQLEVDLAGAANFDNPPQAAIFAPAFTNTSVTVPLSLPETISFSVFYDWTPTLSVMADVTMTRWSRFDRLYFNFGNPAQPDQSIPKNWDDVIRYAVGINYELNNRWELQGGTAFEESAIPDETYEPGIPTTDVWWLNAGVRYRPSTSLSFLAGIVHLFYDDRTVNYIGQFGETLRGQTSSGLTILNLHAAWQF
jgi:long-chain fatty acid transport protein